jgi:hypothetical protein
VASPQARVDAIEREAKVNQERAEKRMKEAKDEADALRNQLERMEGLQVRRVWRRMFKHKYNSILGGCRTWSYMEASTKPVHQTAALLVAAQGRVGGAAQGPRGAGFRADKTGGGDERAYDRDAEGVRAAG